MDNIIILHANNKRDFKDLTVNPVSTQGKYFVHQIPSGEQQIHRDYGLRIFSAISNQQSKPRSNIYPRYYEFYGISHLTKGRGWYWTPGNCPKTIEPGQVVVTTPGYIQDYAGYDSEYVQDYICFCGPVADHLFKAGVIRNSQQKIGNSRLLLPIINQVKDPSVSSQIKANTMLQNLLVELYFSRLSPTGCDNYPRINSLLEMLREEPEKNWKGSEMAEISDMSLSQFHRVFRGQTGYTPKKYLDMIRIQLAAELLCVAENSVTSIASRMGYSDMFHFSRRFKQLTGYSPLNYRRQFGQAF